MQNISKNEKLKLKLENERLAASSSHARETDDFRTLQEFCENCTPTPFL